MKNPTELIQTATQALSVAVERDLKERATKCFQRYSSTDRSNLMASHRLTLGQRESTGDVYWVHEYVPGVAFATRKEAIGAARRRIFLNSLNPTSPA